MIVSKWNRLNTSKSELERRAEEIGYFQQSKDRWDSKMPNGNFVVNGRLITKGFCAKIIGAMKAAQTSFIIIGEAIKGEA